LKPIFSLSLFSPYIVLSCYLLCVNYILFAMPGQVAVVLNYGESSYNSWQNVV
jgi:hypothetical protein